MIDKGGIIKYTSNTDRLSNHKICATLSFAPPNLQRRYSNPALTDFFVIFLDDIYKRFAKIVPSF